MPARAAWAQADLVTIDNTGPQVAKLLILLVFFAIVLIGMRHVRLPQIIRSGAAWLALFALLIGIYSYREPLEAVGREFVAVLIPGTAVRQGEKVMVRRSFQGQFVVDAAVDGTPVTFLFDTGASLVVMAANDARRAGFDVDALEYRIPVMTAAGITHVAPVDLGDITVGTITKANVRAAVAKPGELDTSLLGLSFLDRLSGYEVRRDRLILTP
ncbi:MAG: TIGR02281 family clan AA aspartic protease [Acuticoccus sp.]